MAIDLGAGIPVLPAHHWDVDPTEFALDRASRRQSLPRLPGPSGSRQPFRRDDHLTRLHRSVTATAVCSEVGRRLLLAQLTWSNWVLRRVEKVSFISDRRLLRASTVELRVPEFLPTVTVDGEPHHLVPVTLMRRRTLVNLDLADEHGNSLSLLGLRFTQQLDQSMLWAAAGRHDVIPGMVSLDRHLSDAVSGEAAHVRRAYALFAAEFARARDAAPDERNELRMLESALDRLWHNFTLYVTLPEAEGRHRRLRLAFAERMKWEHQLPAFHDDPHGGEGDASVHYLPMKDSVPARRTLMQSFGFRPTRLRFLTPGAQACASYHFEFNAPTGIAVDRADLVAGRPNSVSGEPPRVSCDSVVDPGHSAGLHAVEVPPGSLCRAQVDLRLPRRGWLSTLLASMIAVAGVLVAVLLYARQVARLDAPWNENQATNVVVLLVSVTAGAATYVAQQHPTDVMTRLGKALRLVATTAVATPAIAAATITLMWQTAAAHPLLLQFILAGITIVEVVASLVVAGVWLVIWHRERSASGRPSPWDMTHVMLPADPRCPEDVRVDAAPRHPEPVDLSEATFDECCKTLGMKQPAVGVYSAEGWLEHYRWSDQAQDDAVRALAAWRHQTPGSCPVHLDASTEGTSPPGAEA